MFRLYEVACSDGYPIEWHTIKNLVREQACHRCVRCRHPYRNGEHGRGERSPCDVLCLHGGPLYLDGVLVKDHKLMVGDLIRKRIVVEAPWRILTVHHLSGNKLQCSWWNLAALCQRCHLSIQARVKLHLPYFLAHTDWFKPFVAGYYAHSVLGEDLTREETMARIDELLELGTVTH